MTDKFVKSTLNNTSIDWSKIRSEFLCLFDVCELHNSEIYDELNSRIAHNKRNIMGSISKEHTKSSLKPMMFEKTR